MPNSNRQQPPQHVHVEVASDSGIMKAVSAVEATATNGSLLKGEAVKWIVRQPPLILGLLYIAWTVNTAVTHDLPNAMRDVKDAITATSSMQATQMGQLVGEIKACNTLLQQTSTAVQETNRNVQASHDQIRATILEMRAIIAAQAASQAITNRERKEQ